MDKILPASTSRPAHRSFVPASVVVGLFAALVSAGGCSSQPPGTSSYLTTGGFAPGSGGTASAVGSGGPVGSVSTTGTGATSSGAVTTVGMGTAGSGTVGSGTVGSGTVGSGTVGSGTVGSGTVGTGSGGTGAGTEPCV